MVRLSLLSLEEKTRKRDHSQHLPTTIETPHDQTSITSTFQLATAFTRSFRPQHSTQHVPSSPDHLRHRIIASIGVIYYPYPPHRDRITEPAISHLAYIYCRCSPKHLRSSMGGIHARKLFECGPIQQEKELGNIPIDC